MSYWLLRRDAPSIIWIENATEFSIRSRRQPRIEEGDTLVAFVRSGDTMEITESATVTRVARESDSDGERYLTTTIFSDKWLPLSDVVDLKSALYSLTLVKNLDNPLLHFRLGYRSLSKTDYNTITSGEVFVSRSAYYILLQSLPSPMQTAFQIQRLIDPIYDNDTGRFAQLFQQLRTFISDRIVSVGEVIQSLANRITQADLRGPAGESLRHQFCDPANSEDDADGSNRAPDDVSIQAHRFAALRESTEQYQRSLIDTKTGFLFDFLQDMSSETRASEQRFEKLFAGRL